MKFAPVRWCSECGRGTMALEQDHCWFCGKEVDEDDVVETSGT